MEKEEAIEVVKKNYPHVNKSGSQFETALRTLIPELAESKDERIRKALIEYFNEQCDMSDWNGVYGYQVVAWLEKQGEQKPADKVDSNLLTVERAKEMSPFMMSSFENESAAWSEEDEDKFNQICSCVEAAPSDVCYYSRETLENWLKSLRHQTTWKPSDEQINALAKNVEYVNVGCTQSILKALLEDLKKLMEE